MLFSSTFGLVELLRIKEVLKKQGRSSKSVIEDLGISQSYFSDLLRNKKTPSIETLRDIANSLDVDIRDLFHPTKEDPISELAQKAKDILEYLEAQKKE